MNLRAVTGWSLIVGLITAGMIAVLVRAGCSSPPEQHPPLDFAHDAGSQEYLETSYEDVEL